MEDPLSSDILSFAYAWTRCSVRKRVLLLINILSKKVNTLIVKIHYFIIHINKTSNFQLRENK